MNHIKVLCIDTKNNENATTLIPIVGTEFVATDRGTVMMTQGGRSYLTALTIEEIEEKIEKALKTATAVAATTSYHTVKRLVEVGNKKDD